MVRPTFQEEHPALEKEGPTQFEASHRSVHCADPRETIPPEEPDLLLPEEIFSAASQVEHLFSSDSTFK